MTLHSDIIPGEGERHLIFGTSRSGKSSHLDWEMRGIQEEEPDCMSILVDTKPRFRAETERMPHLPKSRTSASWRYKHWAKGPVVPGSVLVDIHDAHPFRGLWTRPGEIALLQSGEPSDWLRMLHLLMAYARAHIGDRRRHVFVDEVLDFYGRGTHSIQNRSDVFYLLARSGGERKIGESLGAQRVYGLPILIRNMASRVTLYNLSEEKDLGYLSANGIHDARSPSERFAFWQWYKELGGNFGTPVYGRLDLPEDYLNQLSAA
jgi:hypothetical protein